MGPSIVLRIQSFRQLLLAEGDGVFSATALGEFRADRAWLQTEDVGGVRVGAQVFRSLALDCKLEDFGFLYLLPTGHRHRI